MLDFIGEKQRKELIKRIKNIKDLKEFELIIFEFTCNYETYFKREGNSLLVATCNNHEWDEKVNFTNESVDDWGKIAQTNYYELIFQDEKYVVAKDTYSDKLKLIFFEIDRKITFDYDKTFKLIKKGSCFYIPSDNELIRVKKITDENLKNKLSILANL